MDFEQNFAISAAGLRAQSLRMRIIAENLANQDSVAASPTEDPYRRKLVSFRNTLDRQLGVETVELGPVAYDQAAFGRKYDPGHPSADADGYLRTTNVRGIIESMDMRDAQRSYQANVSAIEASKKMMLQTIELLR